MTLSSLRSQSQIERLEERERFIYQRPSLVCMAWETVTLASVIGFCFISLFSLFFYFFLKKESLFQRLLANTFLLLSMLMILAILHQISYAYQHESATEMKNWVENLTTASAWLIYFFILAIIIDTTAYFFLGQKWAIGFREKGGGLI